MVMGDHGESLGDHGEAAHGFFIYNSVTHVPFVIRTPFAATDKRRVADPVRSVDVMPTVLDLLGVRAAGGHFRRQPGAADGRHDAASSALDAYSEAMYPLHHYGWSDLRALRSGRYKVIDAPRPELYDIDRDPDEPTNLFEERQALGDRMIAQLRIDGGAVREDRGGAAGRRRRSRSARSGWRRSATSARSSRPRRSREPGAPIRRTRSACSTSSGEATELAKEPGRTSEPPFAEDHRRCSTRCCGRIRR